MPSFANIWTTILEWFQDKLDRLNKGPNYTSEYKKTIMDYFGLN